MSDYIKIKEWQPDDFYKVLDHQKRYKKWKTKIYNVINKKYGNVLGIIKWNNGWRQYCFYPKEETVWSGDCLNVVSYFIFDLNFEHKKGWKK